MSKFCIISLVVCGLVLLNAQTEFPVIKENQEWKTEQETVWRLGLFAGSQFLLSDPTELKPVLWQAPYEFDQKSKSDGLIGFQFTGAWSLNQYLIQGLTIGTKIDYSYNDIKLELKLTKEGMIGFDYDGGLALIHTIGFVPYLEASLFTFIENLFSTDLPPYMDVYIYGGARINLNLAQESDLKIEDLSIFNFGYEIGAGVEFFLSNSWSFRLATAYYSNSDTFKIVQDNMDVFEGDLTLDGVKIWMGACYYF